MMDHLQTTLLELVSCALFNNPSAAPLSDEILQEARAQTVNGLIQTDYALFANNVRVNKAHADLTDALSGIPFVTLKGYASASYYPIPEKRAMGDVDFFVAQKDYQQAAERLHSLGYRSLDARHERHETLEKNGVILELHSEIKGIPNGRDGIAVASREAEKVVRNYLSDVIDSAVRIQTQYGIIVCPDAFHHGLIMLLHLAGHIVNDGGVGLRHLCDWAVYADKIDIGAYEKQLREMGLWTFACLLTATCCRHLGLRAMPWTGDPDTRVLDALIGDVLQSGNFSNKASGRSFAAKMQRESALALIAHMAERSYPFCQKHPWLLPVGIVRYSASFLRARISGRRKWVSLSTLTDGKRRVELFDAFKLFDMEGET